MKLLINICIARLCLLSHITYAGRVVLITAKSMGLKGVGIELNPDAAAKAQQNVLAGQSTHHMLRL